MPARLPVNGARRPCSTTASTASRRPTVSGRPLSPHTLNRIALALAAANLLTPLIY